MKVIKNILRVFSGKRDYNTGNATQFINSQNFSSQTNYLIWVDLKNFRTNVFKGSRNKWQLINSYICSIGKNQLLPQKVHLL